MNKNIMLTSYSKVALDNHPIENSMTGPNFCISFELNDTPFLMFCSFKKNTLTLTRECNQVNNFSFPFT